MKCPKCQYISFDGGGRCRNCGYELALSSPEPADLDLPLKTGEEVDGPLTELSFSTSATPSAELPLFRGRGPVDDDAPLVSVPATPRAPVSVRKAAPATRPVPIRRPPAEDRQLAFTPDVEEEPRPSARETRQEQVADEPAFPSGVGTTDAAPAGRRVLAAVIDLGLLAAIDLAVMYLTLKVAGLQPAEVLIVPLMPFLAFIVLLNGGYVAGFTAAGGQTLGKMMTSLKVVPSDVEAWTDRVPLGQAILRAVGYLVSVFPLGLGFLPAFFAADRRALHDRLAHTRVVKA